MVQEKVSHQRQKMGGVNASRENNQIISKQIRVLENRLDKALVKYNETLSQNKSLRERIDNLRRERVVFDGIYKKLERELHEKKQDMATLVEECNNAYLNRDKAKDEMQRLKRRAEDEQETFQAEWKRLGKKIEDDRRSKAMGVAPTGEDEEDVDHRGNMSIDEEKQVKRNIAKGAWAIGKDKAQLQLSQDKVQSRRLEKCRTTTINVPYQH